MTNALKALNQVWSIDPHVRFRRMLDEGVLIHQDKAEAIVLNESAMTFLELCDGERTTSEVLNIMTERYGVHVEQLEADLRPFMDTLATEGIIHAAHDEPESSLR